MTAPASVVAAVQVAASRHEEVDNLDGTYGCICGVERLPVVFSRHRQQAIADAAWAAAYPAALRDAARRLDADWSDSGESQEMAATLFRMADESEA